MPETPVLSLVTPAYNQGEYLAETIDSVLAQDHPAIDFLVLDVHYATCTRIPSPLLVTGVGAPPRA